MGMITRARTHLAVIVVDCYNETYEIKAREHYLQAEKKGLVNLLHLGASNGNGSMNEDAKSHATNAGLIDDEA